MDTGAKPNILKPLIRVRFGYYILLFTAMTQDSPETFNGAWAMDIYAQTRKDSIVCTLTRFEVEQRIVFIFALKPGFLIWERQFFMKCFKPEVPNPQAVNRYQSVVC